MGAGALVVWAERLGRPSWGGWVNKDVLGEKERGSRRREVGR